MDECTIVTCAHYGVVDGAIIDQECNRVRVPASDVASILVKMIGVDEDRNK